MSNVKKCIRCNSKKQLNEFTDKKQCIKCLDYWKKYREDNKEAMDKKHICECGGRYTMRNKARHGRSKKHTNFIQQNN